MSRFLTNEEKHKVLTELKRTQRRGEIDPLLVPYLEEINKKEGICTIQSCQGHKRGRRKDPGVLWLRLDREASKRFRKYVRYLLRYRGIERVNTRYLSFLGATDGVEEVVEIYFSGCADSEKDFLMSIRYIIMFLDIFVTPKHLKKVR